MALTVCLPCLIVVCLCLPAPYAHGCPGTIFGYGQTGSGKTHTIHGYAEKEQGLLPRAIDHIFSAMANAEDTLYLLRVR